AEIVNLQVQALNPFDTTQLCDDCQQSIGIRELNHGDWTTKTQRFYDGRFGATNLDQSTGKIGNGSGAGYLQLAAGRTTATLLSVAESRHLTAGDITPPGLPVGTTAYYEGAEAAELIALPADYDPSLLSSDQWDVKQWVDERSYSRTRGVPAGSNAWQDAPNGNQLRDWLEKKVK